MPLSIRSEVVNQLAEAVARRLRITKTEAVKLALENELHRRDQRIPLRDRLRPIQDRIRRRPATGLRTDKKFYDDLNRTD